MRTRKEIFADNIYKADFRRLTLEVLLDEFSVDKFLRQEIEILR